MEYSNYKKILERADIKYISSFIQNGSVYLKNQLDKIKVKI